MTVRVRYRPGDLTEGIVEEFKDANGYTVMDDNTLILEDLTVVDGSTKTRVRQIGAVHPDRWDSAVILKENP